MTTFIMFWIALLAAFFFLLGFALRALYAVLNAIFASALQIIIYVGIIGGVLLLMLSLYGIIEQGLEKGIGSAFNSAALMVFCVAVICGFFALASQLGGGCLVSLIFALIGLVIETIEFAAEACEDKYSELLKAFINRIPKS